MCFVWIWEQTAIISLYSINWLVSKPRKSSARYELFLEIRYIFVLKGLNRQDFREEVAEHKMCFDFL